MAHKNHQIKPKGRDKHWYRRQVHGLMMIVNDQDKDPFITRDYIGEKLSRIINGNGIGFHQIIKGRLNQLYKEEDVDE